MRFTYLGVDLLTVLVPFLFSFHPRIRFDRWFRVYVVANLISATVFIAWDILFTRLGVWGFNPHYVLGIHIAGLPIEEVLFFFCIP
ncbi:MAG TPA: lycopene cyclase domain-containing protein, partial [Saprospiraceae bacterium]|nr:lycopene cyclase domain-containing protein [Saprospiraceae bacterium]